MIDENIKLIHSEILNCFNSIHVINIDLDKVYTYNIIDGKINNTSSVSFFDFMQDMSSKIEPNDVNGYFDSISANKIEKNNGIVVYNYKIKENDKYKKCINISKLITNQDGKIVISASMYDNSIDHENTELNDLKVKFSNVTNRVSDIILKIFNALDSNSLNMNTSNYITTLLQELVKEFPEFDKELEKNMISQVSKTQNALLIVDDDPMTRNLIKKTFNDKYEIIMATNGKEAMETLDRIGFDNIVGIFLDLMMPVVDGFAVLEYLRNKNVLSKIPVIIISGTEEKETRQKVYKYNIADLLEKPFNLDIIKYRTKNLINLYKTSNALNNMVFSQHNDLMSIIKEIEKSYKYDNKSDFDNIKKYFDIIIKQVLNDWPEYRLSDYEINNIKKSIEFYNIGLYLLPRYLGKNGNISKEEVEIIKKHPILGSKIVSKILVTTKDEYLIDCATKLTSMCYERYDGSGYPEGISGDNIPFWIQCVSLSIDINVALKQNIDMNVFIQKSSAKFNPKIIDSLKKVIEQLKR